MNWIAALLLSTVVASGQIVISSNPFGAFGGGVPYFFSERFEGTGYEQSWSETGTGTINEDYATAPAPLSGGQSLRIAGTVQNPRTIHIFSADQTEVWVFFRLNVVVQLNTARSIFALRDSGAVSVGAVELQTTGTLSARNTVAGTTSVTALTTGTTYNCWMHWKKGTGANGTTSIGFSTGTTEVTSGNQYSQTVVGTSTTDVHDLALGFSANTTGEFIIDKILISTTGTVGNDPQ